MHQALSIAWLTMLAITVQAKTAPSEPFRQLYADYNAALMRKDGAQAAALLHSNIVNAYGEALQLAKTATRDQMRNVPAHQKLVALYLRAAATPEDIAAMRSARDVVAFMINKGALRSDAQMSTDLRDFTFHDDEAFASLYSRGRNTNLRLRFAQEAGEWKIDLTDLNKMADDVYAQTAQLQKVSLDDALVRLVRSATGAPVAGAAESGKLGANDLWIPLNAATAQKTAAH